MENRIFGKKSKNSDCQTSKNSRTFWNSVKNFEVSKRINLDELIWNTSNFVLYRDLI